MIPVGQCAGRLGARVSHLTIRCLHVSTPFARKGLSEIPTSQLRGKLVLVRSDLDCPLKNFKVVSDVCIRNSVPTLTHLAQAGARVVVTGHLGNPPPPNQVEQRRGLVLDGVAERLRQHLGRIPVQKINSCVGPEASRAVQDLKPGQILLLENTRFHPEEESNREEFAKALSHGADIFVNDAFTASRRAHASTSGVGRFIKRRVAGLHLERELNYVGNMAVGNVESPMGLVWGGAHVAEKATAVISLLQEAPISVMVLGGAVASTFLALMNNKLGRSRFEMEQIPVAEMIYVEAQNQDIDVVVPFDVLVAPRHDTTDPAWIRTANVGNIPEKLSIFDIGPTTIRNYREALKDVESVLWLGPMGSYENAAFSKGTMEMGRILADLTAAGKTTVAVGGSTAHAAIKGGVYASLTHVSSDADAALELLECVEPPGIGCLESSVEEEDM